MKKGIAASLAVVGVVACIAVYALNTTPRTTQLYTAEDDQMFLQYCAKYGKSYATTEEFELRKSLYLEKFNLYNEHNEKNDANYRLGVNQFTDMTQDEYRSILGFRPPVMPTLKAVHLSEEEISSEGVNWNEKGKVNPVRDQASCGSCWAFSAVAAMESRYAIKTGTLLQLSEQQLVDCSKSFDNNGCHGGLMDNAFKYAEENAMDTRDVYPYEAYEDDCKVSGKGTVKTVGFKDVKENSASQLKAALEEGPVSVAIQADSEVFQGYDGGVIDATSCGTNLDHGVTAVGWGKDAKSGKEYILVRNSWGSGWGEKGHVRIAIVDGEGICGINKMASYPTF